MSTTKCNLQTRYSLENDEECEYLNFDDDNFEGDLLLCALVEGLGVNEDDDSDVSESLDMDLYGEDVFDCDEYKLFVDALFDGEALGNGVDEYADLFIPLLFRKLLFILLECLSRLLL